MAGFTYSETPPYGHPDKVMLFLPIGDRINGVPLQIRLLVTQMTRFKMKCRELPGLKGFVTLISKWYF